MSGEQTCRCTSYFSTWFCSTSFLDSLARALAPLTALTTVVANISSMVLQKLLEELQKTYEGTEMSINVAVVDPKVCTRFPASWAGVWGWT